MAEVNDGTLNAERDAIVADGFATWSAADAFAEELERQIGEPVRWWAALEQLADAMHKWTP